MNLETLKKAGICFDYNPTVNTPEIPRVMDVLFAMSLTNRDLGYYSLSIKNNHPTYVKNVSLVIVAVATEIFGLRCRDGKAAKKIIAKAILELCPPEARCLHKIAFSSAVRLAGEDATKPCECPSCQRSQPQ